MMQCHPLKQFQASSEELHSINESFQQAASIEEFSITEEPEYFKIDSKSNLEQASDEILDTDTFMKHQNYYLQDELINPIIENDDKEYNAHEQELSDLKIRISFEVDDD